MIWKMSPLVKSEILGVFVNTINAHHKHPFRDCENLPCNIQLIFSKKQKTFSHFFPAFLEFSPNFEHLQKKKVVIANVLPLLQTVKYLVRPLSKKRRFRTSFDSENVKGSLTLAKSVWEHFHHIFSSLWEDVSWKVCPLVKFQILGVSVNTLTANEKYPFWHCGNIQFLIQMQLC